MLLPMQSRPVKRTTIGEPPVYQTRGAAGGADSAALGRGVEPSDFWSDLQKGIGVGWEIKSSPVPTTAWFRTAGG
jgi:hypothetical protein